MKTLQKILVVDDSKLARLTLSRLLCERGLNVVEASSVSEGLEILNNEPIDAVFMDVLMPEKDGFEGVELIKSNPRLRYIPCSMYSGNLSVEAQQKAIDSGAQAYLFKPASADGIDHVLRVLASNVVDKDMQKLVDQRDKGTSSDFSQALAMMDKRTRNLVRLITRDRKSNCNIHNMLEKQIGTIAKEFNASQHSPGERLREEQERKRDCRELKAQLEKLRNCVKVLISLTVVSFIVAIVAVYIAIAM